MYEYRAKVEKIVDGDTMDLSIDLGFDIHYASRVRLKGIDTPESRTRNLEEKKLGLAAKARVVEFCPVGSTVTLKTSKDGKGKFGRILGEIWINANTGEGINVNQTLIDEGHARWYMGGSKDEMGEWTVDADCSHNCNGKKMTRGRKCDGTWTRWTHDGYVAHDVDV